MRAGGEQQFLGKSGDGSSACGSPDGSAFSQVSFVAPERRNSFLTELCARCLASVQAHPALPDRALRRRLAGSTKSAELSSRRGVTIPCAEPAAPNGGYFTGAEEAVGLRVGGEGGREEGRLVGEKGEPS